MAAVVLCIQELKAIQDNTRQNDTKSPWDILQIVDFVLKIRCKLV